jgi:hypothetical protein
VAGIRPSVVADFRPSVVAMSTLADVRRLALALPGAVEADHHGMPSFRVRTKIFATVPDAANVRIFLDENQIREAVAEFPEACHEHYWGKKLSCVRVEVAALPVDVLGELLADAHRAKSH